MPTPLSFNRRHFLRHAGALIVASSLIPMKTWASPVFPIDPFQLGVASGDPSSDGFVLWTRLAPNPVEPLGGLPNEIINVRWEVASDPQFQRIVQQGTEPAHPALAHSVHVELQGLRPRRSYWYRFLAGDAVSPIGQVRTAPALNDTPERIKLAVAGCHHYEAGYFTAFDYLSREEDLDLVFHYGDYIYETASGSSRGHGGLRVQMPERAHIGKEAYTLEDYRTRYGQYKSDPHLKAAHAAAAFAITFDDHEVDNDWAGVHDTRGAPEAEYMARRAAAFQAWYEHMPVRLSQKPNGPDVLAYRSLQYGQLLRLNLLDTRQYRDDQFCTASQLKKGHPWCRTERTPDETLLGSAQEAWLTKQIQHDAQWNVLAQQVMLMPQERRKSLTGNSVVSMDKWSGYPHARERLVQALKTLRPHNNIVLSGDLHQYFVGVVPSEEQDVTSTPIATEFLTTSLTSGGDGSPERPGQEHMLANNPNIAFVNDQRGYQTFEFTPRELRTELKVMDRVEVQGGALSTCARFIVEAGNPMPQRG